MTSESVDMVRKGGEVERRTLRRTEAPGGLTKRAIWIGMTLVCFVAAFTPYNDYVLHNSPFIGNHFPIGILTLVAALILVVNPLLSVFTKKPLGTGELIVIMTMMLVGAAVPSSGLMRYLEPMVVSPFYIAREFPWLQKIADLMPAALTPSKDGSSPIVTNYWYGVDTAMGGKVPIRAFLLPQLLWGILIAAVLGSAFFLAAIFRKQWVHHERLTFPLATIPLELMAAPEPGRWFNRLWRNPLLWVGAAIPMVVYLMTGLHQQFPSMPYIDLFYDFREAFTERPWDALPVHITTSRLYLSVVGVCFFVPSEIAFSLWFFMVASGFAQVLFSRWGVDLGQNEPVRGMGIYVGYFAGLLWLARGHLWHVLQGALRGTPREEGEPVRYRTMVLGWGICSLVAWVWLIVVGMTPWVALVLLALGTMLVTLMARIVAESGLFYVGPMWWPQQFIAALIGPKIVNQVSFYWAEVTTRIFYADLRETLMPYAVNSMRMGQELRGDQRGKWFAWLLGALFVSTVVSGGMNHYLDYSVGRTRIGDTWATHSVPMGALQETRDFTPARQETSVGASWGHFTVGLVMVVGLMIGRVTWVAWPFHPIGLVLMNSGPLKAFWFSIFIGWCVKRLLLRYGGAAAFRRARPFFIGLIVGEMLSAGLWMFVGLCTGGAVRFTLLPG
jgi:hypothetical protein